MNYTEIRTWQEAKTMLPALKFDLGQSAIIIADLFRRGCYLKYDTKMNCWVWYEDTKPEFDLNGDMAQQFNESFDEVDYDEEDYDLFNDYSYH